MWIVLSFSGKSDIITRYKNAFSCWSFIIELCPNLCKIPYDYRKLDWHRGFQHCKFMVDSSRSMLPWIILNINPTFSWQKQLGSLVLIFSFLAQFCSSIWLMQTSDLFNSLWVSWINNLLDLLCWPGHFTVHTVRPQWPFLNYTMIPCIIPCLLKALQ